MPYGLSVFATEALQAGLVEKTATIGEIFRLAKVRALQNIPTASQSPANEKPVDQRSEIRKLLDNMAGLLTPGGHDSQKELLEHAHLLQLIGDPCLRLVHPESITLTGPAKAKPGSKVEISAAATQPVATGANAAADQIRWELRVPAGRLKQKATPRDRYAASDAQWAEMQTTYEAALDAVLASQSQAADQPWQTAFTIPADARGEYQIRIWHVHGNGYATGTHKIVVE
jgi:hypothetical protein